MNLTVQELDLMLEAIAFYIGELGSNTAEKEKSLESLAVKIEKEKQNV